MSYQYIQKLLKLITGLSEMVSELGKQVLPNLSEGHKIWRERKALQVGKQVVGIALQTWVANKV